MRSAAHQDGGLERVWRTAILPLLEEHHFGDGVDVHRRYGLPALRAALAGKDTDEEGQSGTSTEPGDAIGS